MAFMGDAKVKIGKQERRKPTIYGEDNKNMIISTACFPHKRIHKETWNSMDGVTRNQIDHVLWEKRRRSYNQNVRSYKGAGADTNYNLRLDTEKLTQTDIKEKNQVEIRNRFEILQEETETKWKLCDKRQQQQLKHQQEKYLAELRRNETRNSLMKNVKEKWKIERTYEKKQE
ncbi:hypothetical protein ILUMI_14823 [Ignelater luminosus]|uniref:Uncharacterized protein n=1 Tax=Ignelater luminosus TaxID=2038154 RepID=A0A8K0CPU4_IGNLU|nr:hypothetical protein ILUMI_14823 [Ignelater luminosus]